MYEERNHPAMTDREGKQIPSHQLEIFPWSEADEQLHSGVIVEDPDGAEGDGSDLSPLQLRFDTEWAGQGSALR